MTGKDIIPYDPTRDPKAQDPRVLARNEAQVARDFWGKLRRSIGRVPFLEEAVSAYYCAFDPKTPRPVKAMLLAALAYFVVPSDIIPDFIAGLGFTDDATVLFVTLRMVANHIRDSHRDRARRRLADLGLRVPATADTSSRSEPDAGTGKSA